MDSIFRKIHKDEKDSNPDFFTMEANQTLPVKKTTYFLFIIDFRAPLKIPVSPQYCVEPNSKSWENAQPGLFADSQRIALETVRE